MCARPLIILGARTQAPVIADWVSEISGFRVTHFVENMERERCRGTLEGLPILWVDDVKQLVESHCAVCALGSTHRSRFIEQVAAFGMRFATPMHPSAIVSPKCTIGEGTVVSPGVIIAAFTHLGRHVLLNRGALVGHNVEIGDYVTIGPGANIAGFSRIGEATYIGMGAIVLEQTTVGAHSIVGAGAVVNRDVPDNVTVVGAPARVIKENISGL
ncbi:MAG: acetyltransferase [Gammaproteobacteria bacterium]|nr:acetyltransferase [Gammaproteobacteria bacterium]